MRVLLMMAGAVLATGCATTQAVPRPFPGATVTGATGAIGARGTTGAKPAPDAAPIAPDAPSAPIAPIAPSLFDGRAIAQFAMGFRGVPYRLGGSDPAGFDCSGLVQYVFAQYGISVPRVVEEQYEVGDTIRPTDIRPGDLIFFNTKKRGNGASHVAIAIGRDSFVHAPNSTGVVRVETLSSAYWGARYIGAKRVSTADSVRLSTPTPAIPNP